MWHLLLLVAVAGSTGFATKRFLTHHRNTGEGENVNLHDPNELDFSGSESISQTHHSDGVFTFSSSKSESLTQRDGPKSRRSRASKNGVRAPKVEARSEKRSGGTRLHFRLKKGEITKNVAAKAPVRSSKDDCLFGWGFCFGIMYMMSAGKAEINKLNKTMDETAKLVQELKSELNRRKSSHALQILDSVGNGVKNSCKISGRNEVMLKNTNIELRDVDVKICSPCVNDCGECGSSALTEEPEPQVLEMDQLEAELEFELQKLSGCATDGPCNEKIKPNLDELEAPNEGYHGTDDWNLNYSNSHGVSASELHQKLSHLLIKQQENQIAELESELHQAQSNLHEKEAELQALKDCVKCLTELSLSTVSDDETQALTDPKGTSDYGNKNIHSVVKHSIIGTKRPLDSESFSCYM
ncbi:hypothetical protein GLYMA_13G137900v4 [Glycine max]|uniref:GTD-binding domain-containing protein n=1 Tax=Glycine max TaxID=3847 RepID=K7LZM2_SOYBN|nr:uncharacterized protein LOC100799571 [Glycine max]KAH1101414.1 hypothetical protein GYH30_036129 [Glycine max]KRH19833.1 hypothetical protein GLYMA_13G137900v4 [Glycine max]|eukprot:XP_003541404.1 uncharacterized protein LOC100799571 [Glycine max]